MPTPTTAADVLRAAADLLEKDPALWGRNYWLDTNTGCRCTGGLIAYVIAPGDGDSDPYRLTDTEQRAAAMAAVNLFEQHIAQELLDRFGPDSLDLSEPLIGLWNDKLATGPAHVAATMRAAADAAAVSA